ncbi:MAG: YvcK family protein [Nanoarchaeota archaeon]|nr:YvcK family protein [Nanoarchaeota archaeon]
MNKKKVVTIGGGTGTFQLLKGLKNYNIDLTAVVNMADDGGSSGKLRDEMGVLPPGDIRRALVALSDDAKMLRELFEYRFENNNGDHSLGNLILAALEKITGDHGKAIKQASEILNLKGKVLPVTIQETNIFAELENGRVLQGQTEVSYSKTDAKIKRVFLDPLVNIYEETEKAILDADVIVICPGDLYGSLIPNLLVNGMKEAIQNSNAKIVYVCNIVGKNKTENFKASDFVREIERYLDKKIDSVVLNTKKPTEKLLNDYRMENSSFVEADLDDSYEIVKGEFSNEVWSEIKTILRHDSEEISRVLMGMI